MREQEQVRMLMAQRLCRPEQDSTHMPLAPGGFAGAGNQDAPLSPGQHTRAQGQVGAAGHDDDDQEGDEHDEGDGRQHRENAGSGVQGTRDRQMDGTQHPVPVPRAAVTDTLQGLQGVQGPGDLTARSASLHLDQPPAPAFAGEGKQEQEEQAREEEEEEQGREEEEQEDGAEEEEEEEEEGLFKSDAVNEEDPERDRATQV